MHHVRLFSASIVLLSGIMLTGCAKKEPETQAAQNNAAAPAMSNAGTATIAASVAGIHWTPPARWSELPPKPMRVATYSIPDPHGKSEAAECAVYFFGTGQGGGVDDNVARWSGQFEGAPKATTAAKRVNGLAVTEVHISGTYLAPGGPMMQSQGAKKDYRLLGAIVEAPEGNVFFKTTGPASVIGAAESEFESLLNSITR